MLYYTHIVGVIRKLFFQNFTVFFSDCREGGIEGECVRYGEMKRAWRAISNWSND